MESIDKKEIGIGFGESDDKDIDYEIDDGDIINEDNKIEY